jgi:hypothetical protein
MICNMSSSAVEPIRKQLDESGQLAYRMNRVDNRFVIQYSDKLQYSVAPQLPENHPDQVHVSCTPDIPESIKSHCFTNQILPMIKAWKGAVVLHSSSIQLQSCCVGFFGRSGAGKSTLANLLSLKPEFSFWSDDWFEILTDKGRCTSSFTPSQTRLNPDHTKALKRFRLLAPDLEPAMEEEKFIFPPSSPSLKKQSEIRSLYELIPSPPDVEIHCERLSPAKAFQSISLNIFRLDTRNKEHMKREYTQIVHIVESLPVYRFYYPHDLDQMEASLHFIERHIIDSAPHP